MVDVLLDALIDSAKILPFILLIYIIMELIESARNKEKIEKALSGEAAPIFASLLGVVPECGFSVMCAKLFDKGLITYGTLIAAFLSTGDEGLIVLISGGASVKYIVLMVVIKVLYAIVCGEILTVLLKKIEKKHVCPQEFDCVECGERHENKWDRFLFHPFFHAFKTFVFILIINIGFGAIIYYVGEARFNEFLNSGIFLQPLIASLIGLIPNCGSSIILSQAFLKGALSFGGLMAGLSTNAGIGLLILFKSKGKLKRNLIVVGLLYGLGVLIGYISMLF